MPYLPQPHGPRCRCAPRHNCKPKPEREPHKPHKNQDWHEKPQAPHAIECPIAFDKRIAEVKVQEVCIEIWCKFEEIAKLLPCGSDDYEHPPCVLLFDFEICPKKLYTAFQLDGALNSRFLCHLPRANLEDVATLYLEVHDADKFVQLPWDYSIAQDTPFALPFTGRGLALIKPRFVAKLWKQLDCSSLCYDDKHAAFEKLIKLIAPIILTITSLKIDNKTCQCKPKPCHC